MRDALRALGTTLCRPAQPAAIPDELMRAVAEDAVVVLPAGGFGYRMRSTGSEEGQITQKALLPLPDGDTLVSRLVRQYASAGFRRFVALVNHEGRAVEESLGYGERWGVEIRYSYDPDPVGSGRTGAMVEAMARGVMSPGVLAVVHNADCHIMRYDGSFPHDLLCAHLDAESRGAVATLAAVDGTPYPYTGMRIAEGRVTEVEMYPFIPVPTHTGITVLTPAALASLRENARQSKQNFERDMFPRWAGEGRLAALVISHRSWIAVDDRKAYRIFSQAVEEEAGGASA